MFTVYRGYRNLLLLTGCKNEFAEIPNCATIAK